MPLSFTALLRSIPALVGLVALVAVVPSAAQVGSGRIAYATASTGISRWPPTAVNPVPLKTGQLASAPLVAGRLEVAFIQYAGPAVRDPVMNADGRNEHVAATEDSG